MAFDHSKSYKDQLTYQPPMLLESRPVSLFNQYGQKRQETARPERKKFPQGDKSPDFVLCPSCQRSPVEIYYRKESKDNYRIGIRCFVCGEKTLPFFPRLNIPVIRSKKMKQRAKSAVMERQREYLDTQGETNDMSLSVDEFLSQQSSVLDDLLSKKITSTTLYVKGATVDSKLYVLITDYKGDVIKVKQSQTTTANACELDAVNEALGLLDGPGIICSDNRMAVNLVTSRWKTRFAHLQELKETIINKLPSNVRVEWVPRWKNFANYQIEHYDFGSDTK